jgi:hypothetical protein
MPATAIAAALLLACADVAQEQNGADEPFRIRDAQFVRAPLPGKAPKKAADTGAAPSRAPQITSLMSLNSVVVQGQGGKSFTGRASKDGVGVALALKGVSSGYWVAPLGTIDPPTGEPSWTVSTDFDRNLKPGNYQLLVAAVDEHGVAGQQQALMLCVDSRVPDNKKVCNPDLPLPKAVISLSWDNNADLDLQVETPDGTLVESKQPLTAPPDGDMLPDDVGALDRDSNAGCTVDGIRTENLVWQNVKPSGLFRIYANLFDACKQPAVRFRVEVYTAVSEDDGSEHLQQWVARGGELLDISANGGAARGLFVTEFKFD